MKPRFRSPYLIVACALALFALDTRVVHATGGGGPVEMDPKACPEYNACNNPDGCVGAIPIVDMGYYVHWYGMSRNNSSTDPQRLHCKDRYRQRILADGTCVAGDFVEPVCEQGCRGTMCPHP